MNTEQVETKIDFAAHDKLGLAETPNSETVSLRYQNKLWQKIKQPWFCQQQKSVRVDNNWLIESSIMNRKQQTGNT
jgi:hypothetical protein